MVDMERLVAKASTPVSSGAGCWVSNLTDPEAIEYWEIMLWREDNNLYVSRQEVFDAFNNEGPKGFDIKVSKTSIKDHLYGRCKTCQRRK